MAYIAKSGSVYEAARTFRNRCLTEGKSLFWPERSVWNAENISAFLDAFIGRPNTGDGTFFEKWQEQLADQSDDIHRMAADTIAFYYLFPSRVGVERKRANVEMVIGWRLGEDMPNREILDRVCSAGIGHAGRLYNQRQPEQIQFYLRFAQEVLSKGADPDDLQTCKKVADMLRGRIKSSNPAHNILLHLLFPDDFERIAADSDKQKIVGAFRDESGNAEDMDEALANIRRSLIREYEREDLDFYDEDIWQRWQSESRPPRETDIESVVRVEKEVPTSLKPLNTILFGPPGTGKTYTVQRKAVEIIEPSAAKLSDEEIGEKFRGYRDEGRIEFVTFHPSFSYEEFVEGFRYKEEAEKPLLNDGVFKRIAENAANPKQEVASMEGAKVWKISLGTSDQQHIFDRCIENGEISIGWLEGENLSEWSEDEPKLFEDELKLLFESHHPGGSPKSAVNFVGRMRVGDYVAVRGSQKTIRAIGIISGEYEYREDYDEHPHVRRVEWLDLREHDIFRMNGNKILVQQTVYELGAVSLQQFVGLLPETQRQDDKPYVLIIDEINRGNISRIFGELITLLETDKRRGAENELSVRLPYSGENFSVPRNLHVVGTMNTADRSIALLDVALRRRFEFEEMMPDVEVLRGNGISETICSVFEVLNARITALLDRDHQIGHSYFLSATSPEGLRHALYRHVFPLLQEYFYNDPAQLRRLLGKYEPGENTGFIDAEDLKLGKGFSLDTGVDDSPWMFHKYKAEELEDALRRTFLEE